MAETSTMTIRLDSSLKSRLDKLAAVTHRSKSFLAAEAVREYIELNEWQLQEVQAALLEADKGDFAEEQEVKAVLGKWGTNAG